MVMVWMAIMMRHTVAFFSISLRNARRSLASAIWRSSSSCALTHSLDCFNLMVSASARLKPSKTCSLSHAEPKESALDDVGRTVKLLINKRLKLDTRQQAKVPWKGCKEFNLIVRISSLHAPPLFLNPKPCITPLVGILFSIIPI